MHSQIFKGVQQSFKAKTGFVGDYGLTACDGISRCDPITRWSAVCFRLHTSKCVFYICTAVCYLYYLHLIYYFLISSCCLEVCRGFPLVVLSINRRCCRREKKNKPKKKKELWLKQPLIYYKSLCVCGSGNHDQGSGGDLGTGGGWVGLGLYPPHSGGGQPPPRRPGWTLWWAQHRGPHHVHQWDKPRGSAHHHLPEHHPRK